MSLFDNLKQRKIFQWAVAYLAGAWLLMQLVDVLGERWGISRDTARAIDIGLVVGLFITLVIAWYHGDQGKQRVSGPELLIIAGLLVVGGLALGILNMQGRDTAAEAPRAERPVASDETPWIAVLPFQSPKSDPELESFAHGLTEDISNGLSDFSYLLVLSRSAVNGLAADTADVRQIGRELGARYVLQGAIRSAGATTRITVQLVDANNGTQIWAETFDREPDPARMLQIQDELTDRIVATVADPAGVVVRTLAAPTDRKSPKEMTPYEAVLRQFLFQLRISAEDHRITRAALERAVGLDPGYADAWIALSNIYQQEYMNNLNPRTGSLERALRAAETAVDLDPTSARAHFALAQTRYFMQDLGAFQVSADRAITLNPRNTQTVAMVGILMGYAGDWVRSVELTTSAMELNPHHAGWYNFNIFFNEYRQQHYPEALAIAQKMNLPDYWASAMALAIAHAELGNEKEAQAAIRELLRIWPAFEEEYYRIGLARWIFAQPELIEQVNRSLLKAGINLLIDENPGDEGH